MKIINLLQKSKIIHQGVFSTHYEISSSLILVHYFKTEEFSFINCDTGEEFLFAEDYTEAQKICDLVKYLTEE